MQERRNEIIATCPWCDKVIFRKVSAEVKTEDKNILHFASQCLHCKKDITIRVGIHITVERVYNL